MDRSGSKRVLITGGASGLGKAIALKFSSHGHHVAIVDLNDERGQETLDELKQSGVDAFYQRCDVRNSEDVQSAVAATQKRWGGIGVTCVCPSFFKTNLGESMRSPDKTTSAKLEKLVAGSSDLSADDIAGMIYDAVESNQFLLMPHEKARVAWDYKRDSLDNHLKAQLKLAQQVKEQAQPAE